MAGEIYISKIGATTDMECDLSEAMQKLIDKINATGTRKARPHPTMKGVIIVEAIEPRIISVTVEQIKSKT